MHSSANELIKMAYPHLDQKLSCPLETRLMPLQKAPSNSQVVLGKRQRPNKDSEKYQSAKNVRAKTGNM